MPKLKTSAPQHRRDASVDGLRGQESNGNGME